MKMTQLRGFRSAIVLICLGIALGAGFAYASCSYVAGTCPNYSGYSFASCDCDLHGCPGGPTGPPYYVCWQMGCGQGALFPAQCKIDGDIAVVIICAPFDSAPPSELCPCQGTQCGF